MTRTQADPGNDPPRQGPWSIGIRRGETPLDLSDPPGLTNPVLTAGDVTDLRARFVADPFLAREGDRWSLLFEIMPEDSRLGVVGLAESLDGLRWEYRGVVLREPFHLSYPHIWPWRGGFYMTPETLDAGHVRLYRATRPAGPWEHVDDLIPGRHADPTVFEDDQGWWMFTCTPPGGSSTLRLYHAGNLAGPWIEHPRSPVVEGDRRIARPAGRVFAWDGSLFRVTQDCDPYYGVRVRAFRIARLTPTEYREEPAGAGPIVEPGVDDWNRRGMHHVDAHPWPDGGWIAAVDGQG